MATKKQNKRHVVRRMRRVLNGAGDFFKQIGRGIMYRKYGAGISKRDCRDHIDHSRED